MYLNIYTATSCLNNGTGLILLTCFSLDPALQLAFAQEVAPSNTTDFETKLTWTSRQAGLATDARKTLQEQHKVNLRNVLAA